MHAKEPTVRYTGGGMGTGRSVEAVELVGLTKMAARALEDLGFWLLADLSEGKKQRYFCRVLIFRGG